MDKDSCVIYIGKYFTVEWYYDETGYSSAFEYFLSTTQPQQINCLRTKKSWRYNICRII